MTILCGTDFSSDAEQTGIVAARIAGRLGVPLVLVHVVDELGAEQTVGGPQDATYDGHRARLAGLAERLRGAGAEVEPIFAVGSTDERLLAFAASRGASLVMVGALGRRAGQIPLGSVAEQLMRTTTLPLLAMRAWPGLHEWLDGARPLRIAVADDRTATSDAAVGWVPTLRAIGPIDPHSVHVRAADEHTPTDAGIVDRADALRADLIVLGSAQRRGLARMWRGSVASGVLHAARCSVVIVPGGAA